uniref:Uncharacterized protein n=1 Tax=Rhizophagus irregularis (strain DAOM 181602 / DAOM 197198 / MUCL 43194) TaxID=747089 RepID=U9UC08_RHIID
MSPAYTKQKTRHASVPAESESEWSTNEKLTGYTIVEPKTWQYIKYVCTLGKILVILVSEFTLGHYNSNRFPKIGWSFKMAFMNIRAKKPVLMRNSTPCDFYSTTTCSSSSEQGAFEKIVDDY